MTHDRPLPDASPADLAVAADGTARLGGARYRCALGRGGVAAEKREGDGATPVGRFPLRRVYYRADRLHRPVTGLPAYPLAPDMGWCDAPESPAYNRLVRLPDRQSAERLWREDALYDLIVVVGYNDDPVRAGAGSAIFLHVARPDYGPTEGCVALGRADLETVLRHLRPGSHIEIG